MATDVYVMPMWRFFANDFETPLENFIGADKVQTVLVGPDGTSQVRRRQSQVGWWRRWNAKRSVSTLIRKAKSQLGFSLTWRDEGDVVYSNQFRSGETIQSYLWWLDRQDVFPEPIGFPPPDGDLARKFWWTDRDRQPTYPHLQRCGYFSDYFIPVDFERPILIDREINGAGIEVGRAVCSSQAAYRELECICKRLDLPKEYTKSWEKDHPDSDQIFGVKMSFDHLRLVLRSSIEHGLPVIFWG